MTYSQNAKRERFAITTFDHMISNIQWGWFLDDDTVQKSFLFGFRRLDHYMPHTFFKTFLPFVF